MEIGTAERLTAAASYDLLRRLTEKGVISKERFAKLCSLLMKTPLKFEPTSPISMVF